MGVGDYGHGMEKSVVPSYKKGMIKYFQVEVEEWIGVICTRTIDRSINDPGGVRQRGSAIGTTFRLSQAMILDFLEGITSWNPFLA